MAELVEQYVGELFRKFGRFAPWLPDVAVQLGAVGVLENGEFRRKTTLASLGIQFRASSPGPRGTIDHASAKGVSIRMKTEGQALANSALGTADIGASIAFSKVGGVIMQASGVRARTIENADDVARAILERFKVQAWEEEWAFVDEVRTADSTSILISEEKSSQMDLRATGELAGAVPLSGSFDIAAKRGSITWFLGEKGFTPLFHLSRVKKQWFETFLSGVPTGEVVGAMRTRGARVSKPAGMPPMDAQLLEPVTLVTSQR